MIDERDYTQIQDDDDFFEQMQELAWDFGEQIKTARKSHDMDEEVLAKKLNIKQSYLKRIENQYTQPDIQLQKQIEHVLQIDLTEEYE